jgi:hypothetical protein
MDYKALTHALLLFAAAPMHAATDRYGVRPELKAEIYAAEGTLESRDAANPALTWYVRFTDTSPDQLEARTSFAYAGGMVIRNTSSQPVLLTGEVDWAHWDNSAMEKGEKKSALVTGILSLGIAQWRTSKIRKLRPEKGQAAQTYILDAGEQLAFSFGPIPLRISCQQDGGIVSASSVLTIEKVKLDFDPLDEKLRPEGQGFTNRVFYFRGRNNDLK